MESDILLRHYRQQAIAYNVRIILVTIESILKCPVFQYRADNNRANCKHCWGECPHRVEYQRCREIAQNHAKIARMAYMPIRPAGADCMAFFLCDT